jgi:hypothetical protein
MSLLISGDLRLRRTWQPMDTDAAAYITAVETADGQALEEKTKIAIDNFVLGCKADGIWTAIKASCILAGARTLAGALVPLVGTAPTNNGFIGIGTDYVRKTGLVGDGSTKYLNSNRNNNADPQNNQHNAVWVSSVATGLAIASNPVGAIGASGIGLGGRKSRSWVGINMAILGGRKSRSSIAVVGINMQIGLCGISRSASADFNYRVGGANNLSVQVSQTSSAGSLIILGDGAGSYGNHRLAFYSIGESLDLALLDARVTDLINAFAAAIP